MCYLTKAKFLSDHYYNLSVSDIILKGKIVVKVHHKIGSKSMMLALEVVEKLIDEIR